MPLDAAVSRMTEQKGLELITGAMEELMSGENGVQLAVIGAGERAYEDAFRYFAGRYPGRLAYLPVFDDKTGPKALCRGGNGACPLEIRALRADADDSDALRHGACGARDGRAARQRCPVQQIHVRGHRLRL